MPTNGPSESFCRAGDNTRRVKSWQTGLLSAILILWHVPHLMAETVVLRSGKQVEIIDGAVPNKIAEEVLREASEWLKKGRLDYAGEYWQLLAEKAKGAPASRARAERKRIAPIEFGSFVLLRNNKTLKGRLKANLRADLLGLEGKEEIPVWQIEEIVAEYHPGFSQVSKTFYPLTLLEIKFRGKKLKSSRLGAEIEFTIEKGDGSTDTARLGKDYEILRPSDLGGQIDALTLDRIMKIVVFPALKQID
ncbi:MAG: hypothetical protein HY695_02025 [Deltaproteobacteria bacterium]|nr:hypothetical protein [Deltaproteobacteria bacterium]